MQYLMIYLDSSKCTVGERPTTWLIGSDTFDATSNKSALQNAKKIIRDHPDYKFYGLWNIEKARQINLSEQMLREFLRMERHYE